MKNLKENKILYWFTTLLGPGLLIAGGFLFVSHGENQVAEFKHLGFPIYLLTLLGVGRILGGIIILLPRLPRLKEWAYAGLTIDLLAASVSHAFVGDKLVQIISPLVFLVLVLSSWLLRPQSRKLMSESVATNSKVAQLNNIV